jgi:hypothetical protein
MSKNEKDNGALFASELQITQWAFRIRLINTVSYFVQPKLNNQGGH